MGRKKKVEEALLKDIESYVPQKKMSYKVRLKCKNKKQKEYANLIEDENNVIIFATGSAGTGKSYIALAKGLELLSLGKFEKIIYIMPTCEAGSKRLSIGHLPGDYQDKTGPYLEMVKENCEKILKTSGNYGEKKIVESLFNEDSIVFKIMNFARGNTFDNAFIIIDEAENFNTQEMLLLLTRIGENSKMCILGDLQQCDRGDIKNDNGLKHAIDKLLSIDSIQKIEFTESDIVRNDIIIKILHNW
jgi:phosphate starvation-inducible PhoH-like protein